MYRVWRKVGRGVSDTSRQFWGSYKGEASMGYVYILTNPSFREDWVKIGKTRRPVNVRSAELDNTAVPLPFEVYAMIKSE